MSIQLTRQTLEDVFRTFGFDTIMSAEEYQEGVGQLESELLRLGLDANTAQIQRLPFCRAALDFDNYAYLARFHAYVDNVLTMTLEPTLLVWLCRVVDNREEMEGRLWGLSEELVRVAASELGPMQALAKFLLFETVRLTLVLQVRRYPLEAFRLGFNIDDLSSIAESCVGIWMEGSLPAEIRSLPVLIEAARRKFLDKANEMKADLARINEELLLIMKEDQERRAWIEKELSMCEPKVSLLVRNEMPGVFGTPSLSMEELRSRHRYFLGAETLDALYKRSQRISHRLKKRGDIPKRKGIALLDFVRMLDGEEAIR